MNEQELCKKRLIDLSRQADQKGIVLFSDFLNLNEVKVIDEIKSQEQEEVKYEEEIIDTISRPVAVKDNDVDEFLEEAIDFVVSNNQGSASMLQRKFKIGFNRAADIIRTIEGIEIDIEGNTEVEGV